MRSTTCAIALALSLLAAPALGRDPPVNAPTAGCGTFEYDREHVGPNADFNLGYRSEAECQPFVTADPLRRLAGQIPPRERVCIEDEVEEEIADAFAFAEKSPFPDLAELMTDIFMEEADAVAAS